MHSCIRGFALAVLIIVLAGVVPRSVAAQQSCDDPVPGLTDCVRDKDCIYWDRLSCCNCANGGQEVAINKKKKSEIKAQQEICCTSYLCLHIYLCFYDDARCVDGTCVLGSCGDGFYGVSETCDEGGESVSCDDDCTAVECGDWNVNTTAGETCDDGNTLDGDG